MSIPAGATPRPWATTTNGNQYGSVASTNPAAIEAFCARWPDHGRADVEAYGGALVGESIQSADRELIVAAVNEYEALLALEQEVRHAFRPDAIPLRFERALAGIDAVRSGE